MTMPSTSKSNRRKPKKFNYIPKPKQRWQVKQPTRNWLDLPSDIMVNILSKVGVRDILENVQKVCTIWHEICKDPAMWRIIYMYHLCLKSISKGTALCKHAVDRSQGQLIDITIVDFCDDEILQYLADRALNGYRDPAEGFGTIKRQAGRLFLPNRINLLAIQMLPLSGTVKRSSQLKRLEFTSCYGYENATWSWTESLKKFPQLEELNLYSTKISKEGIETAGHYCPMLKTLKLNQGKNPLFEDSEIAIAIGQNLHELEHLELIGNCMSNIGLQVILDGCCRLKSLDLRRCWLIDLEGDLGKRCLEQIKYLKLPNDSLEGCPYTFEIDIDFDYMRC